MVKKIDSQSRKLIKLIFTRDYLSSFFTCLIFIINNQFVGTGLVRMNAYASLS